MEKSFQIESFCHIRDRRISKNGKTIFKNNETDFPNFIRTAYNSLDIEYSKFFKMDNLSKLAFIAADVLLKEQEEKNIALVLSNNSSSLDTDRKHQKSISDTDNFFPSPAVFVYTLPNICLGEISIKHKLFSENAFFVFKQFNPSALKDYTAILLNEKSAKKVLCGWVNFDNGKYDAFLYIVSNKGTFAHTAEELKRLYQII